MKTLISTALGALLLATPATAQRATVDVKGLASTFKQTARAPSLAPAVKTAAPTQDMTQTGYAAAASGTDTNKAAAPLIKSSPQTYDIGGFKLYMSSSEVMRIAKAKGLRAVYAPSMHNASFADAVDYEIRRMKGGYPGDLRTGQISYVKFVDKQNTAWHIHFRPSSGGQVVTTIEYETPWAGRTPTELTSALVAKYGPPTGGNPNVTTKFFDLTWCGGVRNCYFPTNQPAILYVTGRDTTLNLKMQIGNAALLKFEKEIAAAAQARMGKTAPKASF